MSVHRFVGPCGFKRISHMQEMMRERIELTEQFGEQSGNVVTGRRHAGSSFNGDWTDKPEVIESLRREVAPYIGDAASRLSADRVVVPYDGTEDPISIEASQPDHPPTSEFRASLPG